MIQTYLICYNNLQLNRAKQLYTQGDGKKKGFKFDHVWSIVKDFEKFKDHNPIRRATQPQSFDHASSQSENPTPDSPTQASPGLSSFSLNLDDSDEVGGTSSQRPIGVKKAKLKRKITEETSTRINDLREDNRQLLDFLKKSQDRRQQREENKILYMDLNSIADPSIREYTRNEQSRILNKRLQQQQQQEQQDDMHRSNNAFNQYFNDIGGSGTGIPDY